MALREILNLDLVKIIAPEHVFMLVHHAGEKDCCRKVENWTANKVSIFKKKWKDMLVHITIKNYLDTSAHCSIYWNLASENFHA